MSVERKMGRGFAFDKRDYNFQLTQEKMGAVDKTFQYWHVGAVTDQGSESSCVGHAWANWLKASPVNVDPMRPSGLYELAKFVDEWQGEDYDGTSVRAGAKILKMTGHIQSYSWAMDVDTVVQVLLQKGPVVVGTKWLSNMFNVDKRGFVDVSGADIGGHAYLLYGVNVEKGFVSIRNSWGDWGKKGNAKMWIDDFACLLDDYGECCDAVALRR
jgi:C1A family cysteine protease